MAIQHPLLKSQADAHSSSLQVIAPTAWELVGPLPSGAQFFATNPSHVYLVRWPTYPTG
jgi:hypothetical protein